MNKALITDYIAAYKADFHRINRYEYYKWQAIKCFQDHWDIDAYDFPSMLRMALGMSKNLMDSGRYFPKRMLVQYADHEPKKVRDLFELLYDESKDLYERILAFQKGLNLIHSDYFPSNKSSYQDIRVVVVYLALHYPDLYFLYKYRMYKTLSAKIALPYSPKMGKVEELGPFIEICKIIRHEISKDEELVAMHHKRLADDCYSDRSLNVLTQDVIYAMDKHLGIIEKAFLYDLGKIDEEETENLCSLPRGEDSFKGKKTDHLENEKERKRIGNLGELWAIKYEESRLRELGLLHKIKDIRHISAREGDGTGYDILSYDMQGKVYIEVKTTRSHHDAPFVVTRTELERSKKEGDRYRLYRVYNFNEQTNRADLLVLKGNLEGLCTEPERYAVKIVKKSE